MYAINKKGSRDMENTSDTIANLSNLTETKRFGKSKSIHYLNQKGSSL